MKNVFSFLLILFIQYSVIAQNGNKIELINAEELEGISLNNQTIRVLKKNVIFREGKTMMYCDSATQIADKNAFQAYKNVRIVQDKIVMTGDHLNYDADSKQAVMIGNVVLNDGNMTLKTSQLDYNLANKNLTYTTTATIVDKENTLVSQIGTYDSDKKVLTFYKDVVMTGKDYKIVTDTLIYYPKTKMVYFKGATKIKSKDADLFADEGEYDTEKRQSKFKGRSKVENGDFVISGDFLDYNEKKKEGLARQNVILVSKKDSIQIDGEYAIYKGKTGYSKVFGNPLMKMKSGKDTIFLKADTLLAVSDSIKKERRVFAYHKVKLFGKDFQAVCDSLIYDYSDSLIYFFKDPVLWANNSQITADSIRIQMANNKVSKMYLRRNAFMISTDSIQNYNQVRGKNLLAHFSDNQIRKVDVMGSGECIYFATENDTLLVGMNRVICSSMLIKFAEDNKIQSFSFNTEPDAKFIPPQEMAEPDKRLRGFRWRINEKPQRNQMNRDKRKKH